MSTLQFVSMDADYFLSNDTASMPQFTTVPVRVPPRSSCAHGALQLRLNVQTNVAGFASVELLESGVAVPGFTQNESDIIVGNFLSRPATWRGGNATVDALAGTMVQLRVLFAAAKVFGFQFQCFAGAIPKQ